MAKLTKAEMVAHREACALLDRGNLTDDEVEFAYLNWHEGAENNQTAASAFFTPVEMARELHIDTPASGTLVDLCAGNGRLAYFATQRYKWPAYRPAFERIVCVERNPAYVAIGRILFPEAEWICGDILNPRVWDAIGQVDFAIANPPFGRTTKSDFSAPRYKGPEFELQALDVAAMLAPEGWAIVPSSTAPFCTRSHRYPRPSSKADRWSEATGLGLHRFSSVDPDYHRGAWHGTAPMVELVAFGPEAYGETPRPVPHRTPANALPLSSRQQLALL